MLFFGPSDPYAFFLGPHAFFLGPHAIFLGPHAIFWGPRPFLDLVAAAHCSRSSHSLEGATASSASLGIQKIQGLQKIPQT